MKGNAVNYDNKKGKNFPIMEIQYDQELKKFIDYIPGKEVLDLGIGQGTNSIPLFKQGYNITGVDCSKECLHICNQNCPEINLIKSDIRTFNIEKNKYDLIQSRNVLHFLHKDDSYKIINNIKENLKDEGLIYITVFTDKDFRTNKFKKDPNFEQQENNIYYNKLKNNYMSFYTQKEILTLFKDFKTLLIQETYFLDSRQKETSYCSQIKYIGQKTKITNNKNNIMTTEIQDKEETKKIIETILNQNITKENKLNHLFELWKKEHKKEKINENLTIPLAIDKNNFTNDGFVFNDDKNQVLYILKESHLNVTKLNNNNFWFKSVYKENKQTPIPKAIREMQEELIKTNKYNIGPNDVAYMNLNKRGGTINCNNFILKNYYEKYKDFIKAEIQIIDPQIIVLCMSDKTDTNIKYITNDIKKEFKEKTIIVTAHPTARQASIEKFKKDYQESIKNKRS